MSSRAVLSADAGLLVKCVNSSCRNNKIRQTVPYRNDTVSKVVFFLSHNDSDVEQVWNLLPLVLIKLFDNSMNSKCGTHAESYMPLIILYTSIISPRQRLYLSVGKF